MKKKTKIPVKQVSPEGTEEQINATNAAFQEAIKKGNKGGRHQRNVSGFEWTDDSAKAQSEDEKKLAAIKGILARHGEAPVTGVRNQSRNTDNANDMVVAAVKGAGISPQAQGMLKQSSLPHIDKPGAPAEPTTSSDTTEEQDRPKPQ